jgi:RNA recognition motif-containing protein
LYLELFSVSDGVKEVLITENTDDPTKKNRGYCFIEFESHRQASDCRRRLSSGGRYKLWNLDSLYVDWADGVDEHNPNWQGKGGGNDTAAPVVIFGVFKVN